MRAGSAQRAPRKALNISSLADDSVHENAPASRPNHNRLFNLQVEKGRKCAPPTPTVFFVLLTAEAPQHRTARQVARPSAA